MYFCIRAKLVAKFWWFVDANKIRNIMRNVRTLETHLRWAGPGAELLPAVKWGIVCPDPAFVRLCLMIYSSWPLILKFTTLGPDAPPGPQVPPTQRWQHDGDSQHFIMVWPALIIDTWPVPLTPGQQHHNAITGQQCYCCRPVTLSMQSVPGLIPPINSVSHYN